MSQMDKKKTGIKLYLTIDFHCVFKKVDTNFEEAAGYCNMLYEKSTFSKTFAFHFISLKKL